MSRTYRTHLDHEMVVWGRTWTDEEQKAAFGDNWCNVTEGWHYQYHVNRRARDRKPWGKPPKAFKRPRRRAEKAKVKDAMAKDKDIPIFRKDDQWDWS